MTKFNRAVISVVPASVVASLATFATFAADPSSYTVASDIATVSSSLDAFNTANLLSVITTGLAIAIPLVILWFGFRWVYRKAKGALKRGS